jgi:uncharacterized protein YpmB
MKIIIAGILVLLGILSCAIFFQVRVWQKEYSTCKKHGYENVVSLDSLGYVTCANYSVSQGYFKLN